MLLCRISYELAGCVHQPIVGSGQTNLSHLYFSRLSLAMPAKLNFFKTPTSVLVQVEVGPCPLPLEYQAATSHTGRQPCRVKSLYMKRFWAKLSSHFVSHLWRHTQDGGMEELNVMMWHNWQLFIQFLTDFKQFFQQLLLLDFNPLVTFKGLSWLE